MSVEKLATDTSYAVNGLAFSWGVMTFNNWMMLFSMLFGLATVVLSWYYKRKEDIRQSEKHEAEMKIVNAKNNQPKCNPL